MRLAHVRERHAPAGAPWRLAAALDRAGGRWVDLEIARRRAVASRPTLEHDSVVHRSQVTTLDGHLARGLRVDVLGDLVDGFIPRGGPGEDEAVLDAVAIGFGPPILRPPSFRDFYAFEQHVRTVWQRRGGEVPEAWYRLPVFYFSNTSGIGGPDEPIHAPRESAELDYELEVGALIDARGRDLPAERAQEAIGGYFILNDWSARDLQRDETTVRLGPAKGKDFATSIGPWLVTPDELAEVWRPGATGPETVMTATVNGVETSRGVWSSAQYSFGQMLERASADVDLRPGDVVGSGTVGGGCLLEIREVTIGRYLEPGDVVELSIDRLGTLRNTIVARSA